MVHVLLRFRFMTTCEWIYLQTFLTDLALDHAQTPNEREFVLQRLHELQGRVRFEQRMLARMTLNEARSNPEG